MDAVQAFSEDALLLAQERGDSAAVVRALTKLTNVAVSKGKVAEAVTLAEQAIDVAEGAGDPRSAVNGLNALGLVELARERPGAAREAFERALELVAHQDRRPDTVATLKHNIALASVLAGDRVLAEEMLASDEALPAYRALGDSEGVAYCFVAAAAIHAMRGDMPQAGSLLHAADLLLEEVGASLEPAEHELAASTLKHVESELRTDELVAARDRGSELACTEMNLVNSEGLAGVSPLP